MDFPICGDLSSGYTTRRDSSQPGTLSSTEFRSFWVTWEAGVTLTVGKGVQVGVDQILTYTYGTAITVGAIFISGAGGNAYEVVFGEC